LVGCGSEDPPVRTELGRPDPAGLPPAQIRMMLDGLNSPNPRTQYGALDRLGNFPAVVEAYREHVERLEKEGADQKVREKAAELLSTLDEQGE
jgi:hypothetical protein